MSGSFYSFCNLPLIFKRCTGDPSWQYLTLVIQEFFQEFRILIIDIPDLILLETAVFLLLTSTVGGVKYLISDSFCAISYSPLLLLFLFCFLFFLSIFNCKLFHPEGQEPDDPLITTVLDFSFFNKGSFAFEFNKVIKPH